MKLVIVESPAKSKTISKYLNELGDKYKVLASFGHLRDLPSKEGSVLPDEDFTMIYELSPQSMKHAKAITDEAKKADTIYLATDPDREGEAISWHVIEMLKKRRAIKKSTKICRIVFNEITRKAVTEAVSQPRDIDMNLVNAQQARRALDYLVGFNLSPVLWRKLPGSRSAGRVQSVALRLIAEREDEIERFITREYWGIKLGLLTPKNEKFTATLSHLNGKKLDKFAITDEKTAKETQALLNSKSYQVTSVESKQTKRNPYAPFTTSSLQQEASRKLGFGAKKTMMLAQKLYEGIEVDGDTTGLITYMRTDGVTVAQEAINATRGLIDKKYGNQYLPEKQRFYQTKAKNAQEAHEAIRPTDVKRTPEKLASFLDKDQLRLYELIWKRMVASQMASVVLDQVTAIIHSNDKEAECRATGSTIRFDGFYTLYKEDKDDGDDKEDDGSILPPLDNGDSLNLDKITPEQHFTQPPPRYSEASLVKKMEELGIGRPSTYASIISVLQDRQYVRLDKKRFIPEERGRIVTAFLINYFPRYVEYDFTARMENELDYISDGQSKWKDVLKGFWERFHENIENVKEQDNQEIIEKLNHVLEHHLFPPDADGNVSKDCPDCSKGHLSLKLGRYGAFLGCSNYPDCRHTRQITVEGGDDEGTQAASAEPRVLGVDPSTKLEISLRKGPYGFYLQLGDPPKGEKPKRASVPKGVNIETITLEQAVGLLSLPREVGTHPDTGKVIKAGIGRFGPYLLHDGKYVSIKGDDDVLTIGMNRAVDLIAQGKQKSSNKPLRILGLHPDDEKEIAVYDGRYGPYIKHAKTNAPLPKNESIENITLDAAIALIAERANAPKKKRKK